MDIKHNYRECGEGHPLLLLHGNGESLEYFDNQFEALGSSYHVFALDTRGHGKTPRGHAPFTIRQFADDLAAFMDIHGIERAHILGFSDGGNIAMVFALNYPNCVNKLILNGANMDPSGVKKSIQIPIEIGYRIALLFSKKSYDAHCHAEVLGLMVNDPNLTPGQLSNIDAPTLVIAGTHDMIKASHTETIARCIPHSTLAFIPGDHFIAKRNPLQFNETVLRFLDDHASTSA